MQSTPPHRHQTLKLALKPILVVTMPGVAETFNDVISMMTHGTDFQFLNLLHTANANLIRMNLNTSIDKPDNRWNIHLVSYDT
jgi:hypothetical protein